MRDGYGEPAPVVPISGRAIGAGFQSADAGCALASIAIVTSAPATSRIPSETSRTHDSKTSGSGWGNRPEIGSVGFVR